MARVLVTDGSERAALAIVRSLGRVGHDVVVCAEGRSLAGASRWCQAEYAAPAPLAHPTAFSQRVEAVARLGPADVIIPVTEASLLALLPRRRQLEPAILPFVDDGVFRALSDKANVLRVARELGIATPGERVLDVPGHVGPLKDAALTYPVVVKPSRSVVESGHGRTKMSVAFVNSEDQLETLIGRTPPSAYPLLVQERILGPGIGVFLLVWDGKLVARFGHRRIREKPPAGGVSVVRESHAPDNSVFEASTRLLEHFHWQGVAMVEYKQDVRTGRHYLMEVNGRFWGSLQLAIDAGVDFPRLLVDVAEGHCPQPTLDYPLGVISRWEWGDVDHLLARLRHSAKELSLPPGSPGRLKTLGRFVADSLGRTRGEVIRLQDIGPGLRESEAWIRHALARRHPLR